MTKSAKWHNMTHCLARISPLDGCDHMSIIVVFSSLNFACGTSYDAEKPAALLFDYFMEKQAFVE